VRFVRCEQRSQEAKGAQPTGAGRHRAICFVARSVEYPCGYTSSLASRTWTGGAPAKTGSYFCTDPKSSVFCRAQFVHDVENAAACGHAYQAGALAGQKGTLTAILETLRLPRQLWKSNNHVLGS
jgi:hypothetical protein